MKAPVSFLDNSFVVSRLVGFYVIMRKSMARVARDGFLYRIWLLAKGSLAKESRAKDRVEFFSAIITVFIISNITFKLILCGRLDFVFILPAIIILAILRIYGKTG